MDADEDLPTFAELIRGECWVTGGAAGGVPLLTRCRHSRYRSNNLNAAVNAARELGLRQRQPL